MTDINRQLVDLQAGTLDAAEFTHANHVRLAFEMLERYDFDDALFRYATGLRRITARLGCPEKFHVTITVAFLALVAEYRERLTGLGWDAFIEGAPELLDRSVLERWYVPEVLKSDLARRTFILPRRETAV